MQIPTVEERTPEQTAKHDDSAAGASAFRDQAAQAPSPIGYLITAIFGYITIAASSTISPVSTTVNWMNNPSTAFLNARNLPEAAWRAFAFAAAWSVAMCAVAALAYATVYFTTQSSATRARPQVPPEPRQPHARRVHNRHYPTLTSIAVIVVWLLLAGACQHAIATPTGSTQRANATALAAGPKLGVLEPQLLQHLGLDAPGPPATPSPSPARRSKRQAFAADRNGTSSGNLFVDSGAFKTIISEKALLHNIRECPTETVQGIDGALSTRLIGDMWLRLPHADNPNERVLVRNCLFMPDSRVNLLSTHQLSTSGIGCNIPPHNATAQLYFASSDGRIQRVDLRGVGNLYAIPDIVTETHLVYHARNVSREELWHWRLADTPIDKIAHASKTGKGFGTPLKVKNFHCKCEVCMEGNMIRPDAAPASTTTRTGGWSIDLVDMGSCLTLTGNRYLTIIVVLDTRFVRVFTHKSKTDFPKILLKALAQADKAPTFVRTDHAGEYDTDEIDTILHARSIDRQHSNSHEQEGNARSETLVRMFGKITRAQLLRSNLAPEFWGFAVATANPQNTH